MKLNFNKNGGYVTAIAQDYNTGQVLMVGHANKAAVETALQTGLATWWSMSRNELWTKGLTSGDTLKLKQVRTDCDRDAILYLVEPQGTGELAMWKVGSAALVVAWGLAMKPCLCKNQLSQNVCGRPFYLKKKL